MYWSSWWVLAGFGDSGLDAPMQADAGGKVALGLLSRLVEFAVHGYGYTSKSRFTILEKFDNQALQG